MMTQTSKLLVAFCFALTLGFVSQLDAPRLEAQIVSNACGCGKPKCGGCLKGKLFPVKQLAQKMQPKKPYGCDACASAQPVVTSDVLISSDYLPYEASVAPAEVVCGCGVKGCRKLGCLGKRAPKMRTCPQCDCDFCELKVSKTKEKKKCFEVKQKEVCIPPVRLPWKKCCPPTKAKVRVVNVLKSKTYECPGCKYEWNVYEPEVPKTEAQLAEEAAKSAASEVSPIKEVDNPSAPKMNSIEVPKVEKLDLETVPQPPAEVN